MTDTKQGMLTDKGPDKLRVEKAVRERLEDEIEDIEEMIEEGDMHIRTQKKFEDSINFLEEMIESGHTHTLVHEGALGYESGIHRMDECEVQMIRFAYGDHPQTDFVDPFENSGDLVADML